MTLRCFSLSFVLFDKAKVNTPGFFFGTVAVCLLVIFTQLPAYGDYLFWWAVGPGLVILAIAAFASSLLLLGPVIAPHWYRAMYHVIAVCCTVDATLYMRSAGEPETLYLPLFVALALHSHGYLTGSNINQRLGTILMTVVLGSAVYRVLYTPWVPLMFIITMCVVVFAALLIKSLHVAHLRNATAIKDRADALQSIHNLLMVLASKEIGEPLENIRVLSAPTSVHSHHDPISEQISRNVSKIEQVLADCKLESRSVTSLQEVLHSALEFKYERDVHADVYGMTSGTVSGYHRMFLVILLNKIIENSCRTAIGNWVDLLMLKVAIGPSGLVLEDNAGPSGCFSEVFSTYLDPAMQNLFGFQVEVHRMGSGTRYTLVFER